MVVRYAEQVLFTQQVVPIERVRMITRVVTTNQIITTDVRSEQITVTHHDESTAATAADAGRFTAAPAEGDRPSTGDHSWD